MMGQQPRKQTFDPVTISPGALVCWRSDQCADCLPDGFLLMHKQATIGSSSAALLLRAPPALSLGGTIDVALAFPSPTAISQGFSLWTVVDIFRGFITKLLSREEPTSLITTINDRNGRIPNLWI